jgi:putative sigma-54 modulation protein
MNLTVTGHHVDVTQSMRNYVSGKMKRLQRRSSKLSGIHVILTVEEKSRQKAEATIDVSGARLYADTTEPDMYAAIDLLMDKLDRQLIRHKDVHGKARRRQNRDQMPIEEPLEMAEFETD